jgi:hypothetical protein
MNRKVETVDWSSSEGGTDIKETKPLPFLKLDGFSKSWKVRVVSEKPLKYWTHFTVGKNGQTVKVNCSLDDDCPVQIEKTKSACGGSQAEARFFVKIIDRSDGQIKVLDVGKQIVNGIGDLVRNPEYGPCSEYDITISKGAKGDNPLYKITPARNNSPLSAEEVERIKNSENTNHADFIDLNSRAQPLASESIKKILGLESKKVSSTKPSKAEAPAKAEEEFEDIDWEADT